MNGDPIKVVLFSGAGRSGSTLFASLLGEFPSFVSIGEGTSHILRETMRSKDLPCGCGERVDGCPFWTGITQENPGLLRQHGGYIVRIRALPLLLLPWKPKALERRLTELARHVHAFLNAIQRHTGARVIVDASKIPPLVVLMSYVMETEVHVVHLVRDPRGFVSSRFRPKDGLERASPLKAMMIWLTRNVSAELTAKYAHSYRRIRYEDFVERPRLTLENVASDVLGTPLRANFVNGLEATIGEQHMLDGNPERIGRRRTTIQRRAWRSSRPLEIAVTALLFPLMLRYGYRWSERA